MIKKICFPILILFMLAGCQGEKTVFEEYRKFEKLSWNRFDNLVFTTEITNIEKAYDIDILIRHLPEIPYRDMVINFTINTPSGDMRTTDYTLYFHDADDKLKSNCMGDYCDLQLPLREGFTFSEVGTVRFEIENKYTKVEMPGIFEIGLILKEAKEE